MSVNLHVRVSVKPPTTHPPSPTYSMEETVGRSRNPVSDRPQDKRPRIIQLKEEQLQQYPLFLSLLTDHVKPTTSSNTPPSNCILPQQPPKTNFQTTIKTDVNLPVLPMDTYEDMFQEVVRKFYGENVVTIETTTDPGTSGISHQDLNLILSDYGKDVLDGQNLVPGHEYEGEQNAPVADLPESAVEESGKKKKKRIKLSNPTARLVGEWTESEEVITWTTSKIASYSGSHKIFRCVDCGCVGFLARIAEHWLGTHANIKVFECPRCPYVSAWARCIRMHVSRVHSEQSADVPVWRENRVLTDVTKYLLALKNKQDIIDDSGKGEKKYSCQICQYSTDRRDLYTRHESIHNNEKPFECFVCLKEFNRADHCKKHFVRMHKDVEYDVQRIRKSANVHNEERMDTPMDTSSQSAPSTEPPPPPSPSPLPREPSVMHTESIYLSELDSSFDKGQQLVLRKCIVTDSGSDLQLDNGGRLLRDVPLSHIIRDNREPVREVAQNILRDNAHLQQVIRENVHVVRDNVPRENYYVVRDNPHLVMRDSRDTNILTIVRDSGIVRTTQPVLMRETQSVRQVVDDKSRSKPMATVHHQLIQMDTHETPAPKTEVVRTVPSIREPQLFRTEAREFTAIRELPELLNLQQQQQHNPMQLLQAPVQVITPQSTNAQNTSSQFYQLVTFASLQGSGVVNISNQPQATTIAVQPKTQPGATIHYSPITFPPANFTSPIKESQIKSVVETLVRTSNAQQQPAVAQQPEQKPVEEEQGTVQVEQASTTTETSPNKRKKVREKVYSCTFCSWKGVDNWCLKRHLNTHIRPFLCVLCDYKAARSERLSTHMQKVHNKRICTRCSFITNDLDSLTLHIKENH